MSSNHCNDSIFCIQDFVDEIEKLRRNNSYNSLDSDLLSFLKDKTIDHFKTGRRLNKSDTVPYIKHDIKGRGGFRLYYLAFVVKGCVYLGYIHPKTGKYGVDNVTEDARASFPKKILECIKSNSLYKVDLNTDVLAFERVSFNIEAK